MGMDTSEDFVAFISNLKTTFYRQEFSSLVLDFKNMGTTLKGKALLTEGAEPFL